MEEENKKAYRTTAGKDRKQDFQIYTINAERSNNTGNPCNTRTKRQDVIYSVMSAIYLLMFIQNRIYFSVSDLCIVFPLPFLIRLTFNAQRHTGKYFPPGIRNRISACFTKINRNTMSIYFLAYPVYSCHGQLFCH